MSDAQAPAPALGGETRRVSVFSARMIMVSGVLALIGLGLTLAHFIWPTPLMLTVFMILGQSAYGAGMAIYFLVIFIDLRRQQIL